VRLNRLSASAGSFHWQSPDDIFCRAALSPHRPNWELRQRAAADPASAQSGTGEPSGGTRLSLFGDVKYPVRFQTFDYVHRTPQGRRRAADPDWTFDNFNLAVPVSKARSPPLFALVYESLTTPSLDEVSTEYGAIGRVISHPGFLFRCLPPCGAGEMARRQAGAPKI